MRRRESMTLLGGAALKMLAIGAALLLGASVAQAEAVKFEALVG